MKRIAGLLIGAIVIALAATAALAASRFERHMADAQQLAATGQYDEAAQRLDDAEHSLRYGRWIPGLTGGVEHELGARRAGLQYWQRQYEAIVPAQAEPVSAVDETNVDLQLVVANAAFRVGPTRAKDKESLVQALDEAASGYLTVLKNETWSEDAAYNYEYVVRLRDEVARGRRQPPQPKEQKGDFGESGAPSDATSTSGFKIYVPLQGEEKNPEGGEAGKSTPKDRKG